VVVTEPIFVKSDDVAHGEHVAHIGQTFESISFPGIQCFGILHQRID
jgi:hypothetical protein